MVPGIGSREAGSWQIHRTLSAEKGPEGTPRMTETPVREPARGYALIVRTQILGCEIEAYQFPKNSNGG